PPKHPSPCLQLFVMDDDGKNVEQIGYLNIGMALHPTILVDRRVVFSSLESQGLRNSILLGLWSIHPDATHCGPVISPFAPGGPRMAAPLKPPRTVVIYAAAEVSTLNISAFASFLTRRPVPPVGYPAFGPVYMSDSVIPPLRFVLHYNGKGKCYRIPFMAAGI